MADVWRPPGEAFVFRLPFQAARALRGRKLGVIHLRGSFPLRERDSLLASRARLCLPGLLRAHFVARSVAVAYQKPQR